MAHQVFNIPTRLVWTLIASAGQTIKTLETNDKALKFVESPAAPTIEYYQGFRLDQAIKPDIVNLSLDADFYVIAFQDDVELWADIA